MAKPSQDAHQGTAMAQSGQLASNIIKEKKCIGMIVMENLHIKSDTFHGDIMEQIIKIKIQKLPEGVYLATSDDVQGLVAQGRTVEEALEISRDVAKKLIEAQKGNVKKFKSIENSFEYPLVVGI